MLGVNILGVVSDGGGGNENFFRQMADNSPMIGPWRNGKSVFFVNLCDTSRKAYFWSCGTHSLNVMRNNLYRSQHNMACNLRMGDVFFG